ncbi:MAG: spore coat protein [Candidatus Onthomonas sp.]|nr:spore coat protein [Candidatus Onthomonas sp.]
MANLTTKELSALEDQLSFEHVCVCKYQAAAAETQENTLRDCFNKHAGQHQQSFNTLLTFLK